MRKKQRKGFSLVELLVGIVVLGILGAMMFSVGSNAQERARTTAAYTVLDQYVNTFTTACLYRPGMISDRLDTWEEGGSGLTTYSSQQAFQTLVNEINQLVDNELQMIWDSSLSCYRSQGIDPWGGYYILLEYPEIAGSSVVFDPTVGDIALRCSFWALGKDDALLDTEAVSVDSVGIALNYQNGYVSQINHGVEEGVTPLTGATLTIQ